MRLPRALRPPSPAAPLLLSAVLIGIAFPPFHLLLPSFVALVPYAAWVARLPAGEEGRSAALRGGFLLGLVSQSLLLYWLATALLPHTPLAPIVFLLAVGLAACLVATATLGVHQAVRRLGLPVWAALPLFWTAMEWLRAHLGDLSFPWMGLGDSLTGYPLLLGGADLVGSRGLTAWLALCNGLLAEALLRRRPGWLERYLPDGEPARRRSALVPLAGAAALVAAEVGYSAWRWHTLELRPAARVGVVQPDVAQELKLRSGPAVDTTMARVRRLVGEELAAAGPLDLVVLPETAFPVAVDGEGGRRERGGPDPAAFVSEMARLAGAPVLYGAVGTTEATGGALHRNSVFLRGPSGRRLGSYHKRRLVPLVERVPWAGPALGRGPIAGALGPGFGGYVPGPEPTLLAAGDAAFGVLVCYESIFAGMARDYRRQGADFLVNVTNDAWFGRAEAAWSRTSALWQHPAHLVMRAVEHRMGVVRSANTGISQTVDPLGRVGHRTGLFVPAAFAAPVLTTRETTPYTRWGDAAGWSAALASLGVALASGWVRRPRRPGVRHGS